MFYCLSFASPSFLHVNTAHTLNCHSLLRSDSLNAFKTSKIYKVQGSVYEAVGLVFKKNDNRNGKGKAIPVQA